VLDAYLGSSSSSSVVCDPHVAHLLFSANRWETSAAIRAHLAKGTHVIVDRYSASGIAYSIANGLDPDWCTHSDRGLPTPDAVLYLDVTAEQAEKRAGFGGERYERREFQERVAKAYATLRSRTRGWHDVDGNGTSEVVAARVELAALACISSPTSGSAGSVA